MYLLFKNVPFKKYIHTYIYIYIHIFNSIVESVYKDIYKASNMCERFADYWDIQK